MPRPTGPLRPTLLFPGAAEEGRVAEVEIRGQGGDEDVRAAGVLRLEGFRGRREPLCRPSSYNDLAGRSHVDPHRGVIAPTSEDLHREEGLQVRRELGDEGVRSAVHGWDLPA